LKMKWRYLRGGRQDREQVREILSHLAGNTEEFNTYLHLLRLRAENLVARFWPEVEFVAQKLLSENTLTSDQIPGASPLCARKDKDILWFVGTYFRSTETSKPKR
jgi:hypothetical protein